MVILYVLDGWCRLIQQGQLVQPRDRRADSPGLIGSAPLEFGHDRDAD